MNKLNYINNLHPHIINVNEKIQKKYLHDFLKDKISVIGALEKDIYYSYLFFSKQYQITYSKDKIPFVYIFELYYVNKALNDNIDLFFTKDYFVIYYQQMIYFYKENKQNLLEDILEYVKYELKLEITNVIKIKPEKFLQYKQEFLKKTQTSFRTSFTLYAFFVYIIIFIFVFQYYYSTRSYVESITIQKTNEIRTKSFTNNISLLFVKLDKHHLKVKHFQYQNNELRLSIQSKNINNFYDFLKNEKIEIPFTYEKHNLVYEINAVFTF